MYKQYLVLVGTRGMLSLRVEAALAKGWELHGQPFQYWIDGQNCLAQAVTHKSQDIKKTCRYEIVK